MRKFENVDIINSLRRIMNINTEHYKNDFFLDVDTIHTAALSDSAEDKYLLFMSRLNGTYCYCENVIVKYPPFVVVFLISSVRIYPCFPQAAF